MKTFYVLFTRAEAVLAGMLLMLMVALIFAGGVSRMLFTPLNWTIDLATCSFAWGAFLCADIAWRRDLLMSVGLVSENAPRRVARALVYINFAIIAGFLAFILWYGVSLTWTSRGRSFNGIPDVSYSWVTASLPAGAFLMLLTTAHKVRRALQEDGVLSSSHVVPAPRIED